MFIQKFGANHEGRDFIIGDLHGMYDLLMKSLNGVNFNRVVDRCFSCGDLIDRGPDSEKCLTLIQEQWFHCVRGNHEDCLIEIARNPSSALMADWLLNGGRWHLNVSCSQMKRYADELDRLPFIIEIVKTNGQRVAVCHAEYPLNIWDPERIEADASLTHAVQWSRAKVQKRDPSVVSGIDHVFCGHTIVDKPVTLGNTHYIDTGAFDSGRLMMIPLSDLD